MSEPVTAEGRQPNPLAIWDIINAHQKGAAFKAAIDLEIFTHIARGARTTDDIARAARASARGTRILCDGLVMLGLLDKNGSDYSLSLDSSVFLTKDSPAYIGGVTNFLLGSELKGAFEQLTEAVRRGSTAMSSGGTVTAENPVWVDFATSMGNLMRPGAKEIAEILHRQGRVDVLDIAAGHGLFGIAIAERNPEAHVTALDWKDVLSIAVENAKAAGVESRFKTIAGDAFTVELAGPYDVILLTNILHHFDKPTCESLLRRVRQVLKPNGVCATLEFVPNEDRVSPIHMAWFSLIMLASTPSGDAYTFFEYDEMFRNSGFSRSEAKQLQASPEVLLLSYA
jgi:2-polyprenyl-3-methyl-5-hydroxy-6-metoxy-1,4-benzoquinol methylase